MTFFDVNILLIIIIFVMMRVRVVVVVANSQTLLLPKGGIHTPVNNQQPTKNKKTFVLTNNFFLFFINFSG